MARSGAPQSRVFFMNTLGNSICLSHLAVIDFCSYAKSLLNHKVRPLIMVVCRKKFEPILCESLAIHGDNRTQMSASNMRRAAPGARQ